MLTIIGAHPNPDNEKDGMIQRIAAIDDLIKEQKRRYLEIHFRRYWNSKYTKENGVDVYKLNFFMHFFKILRMLMYSRYIYVHSIYNSLNIFPFYFFFKNIITDLHGVVPDELNMYGKNKLARLYNWIEKKALLHSYKIIAVTEAMEDHYIKKYPLTQGKFLFISIFSEKRITQTVSRNKNGVIYSGGTQKWQCIDKMIDLVRETSKNYKWTILTGDTSRFDCLDHNEIILKSVRPKDVQYYYGQNTFGIVLREDSIVNRVACPTKMVEYILNGVIPVVLYPQIGDFYKYGYKFITYENFKNNNLPSQDEINEMRRNNYEVLENIMKKTNDNIAELLHILSSKPVS